MWEWAEHDWHRWLLLHRILLCKHTQHTASRCSSSMMHFGLSVLSCAQHPCLPDTAGETLFHSFPFRLNVKSQWGMKLKDNFCCVIWKGTQCAKSLGFCCLLWMMDGYVGVVHLSVVMQGGWFINAGRQALNVSFFLRKKKSSRWNKIRYVIYFNPFSQLFKSSKRSFGSWLGVIWQPHLTGGRQLHLDRSDDRRGNDKNKPRAGARFPAYSSRAESEQQLAAVCQPPCVLTWSEWNTRGALKSQFRPENNKACRRSRRFRWNTTTRPRQSKINK